MICQPALIWRVGGQPRLEYFVSSLRKLRVIKQTIDKIEHTYYYRNKCSKAKDIPDGYSKSHYGIVTTQWDAALTSLPLLLTGFVMQPLSVRPFWFIARPNSDHAPIGILPEHNCSSFVPRNNSPLLRSHSQSSTASPLGIKNQPSRFPTLLVVPPSFRGTNILLGQIPQEFLFFWLITSYFLHLTPYSSHYRKVFPYVHG
jgi:hypothetical protein